MSMLTFFINRAGSNLPASRKNVLQRAKGELRKAFGRDESTALPGRISSKLDGRPFAVARQIRSPGEVVMWYRMLAAALLIGLVAPAAAVELNPAAVAFKLPAQIPWKANPLGGNENAVLVGDPAKPGLYVVINKWKAAT